jgi:hypothetical protein
MTDEVVRRHLLGRDAQGRDFVAGIYPMLLDETCFFLAVDFDKGTWQQDASAYLSSQLMPVESMPAHFRLPSRANDHHLRLLLACRVKVHESSPKQALCSVVHFLFDRIAAIVYRLHNDGQRYEYKTKCKAKQGTQEVVRAVSPP